MAPFAPGLFSTTAGWPSSSWNFEPMARPTMSEEPPATNGMITRIGLDGNDCAIAAGLRSAAAKPGASGCINRYALKPGRPVVIRTMQILAAFVGGFLI